MVTDDAVRTDWLDLGIAAGTAAEIMAAAFGLSPAEQLQRQDIFSEHARRPDLISRGAYAGSRLVGFCYGFPAGDGSWWERQIQPRLAAVGAGSWLSSATFELTELHVHPGYQRRGLGRRLITEVCDASDRAQVLLSVRTESAAARRLYRELGFAELTTSFLFGGVPPHYLLMGATQPLRR